MPAEGDDLVMERVPSAKSKAAEESSSVKEGSQAVEPPQTNPDTGEETAPSAAEGAEGGAAEEGEEHQMTTPLPRTVSHLCVCSTTVLNDIVIDEWAKCCVSGEYYKISVINLVLSAGLIM